MATLAAGGAYATLKPLGYCCAYASLESSVGTLMGNMGTGPLDSEGISKGDKIHVFDTVEKN